MPESQYEERTIKVNRVAKVVKGGRRFSFTALMVIGDGNGEVGLGYGKAKEAGLAVQKGIEEAKKNLFEVPLAGSTITHPVIGKAGAVDPAEARRARYRCHRRRRGARHLGDGRRPRHRRQVARHLELDQRRPRDDRRPARAASPRRGRAPPRPARRGGRRPPACCAPTTSAVACRGRGALMAALMADAEHAASCHPGESAIGTKPKHRGTLRALGLRRHRPAERAARPPRDPWHASPGATPRIVEAVEEADAKPAASPRAATTKGAD